MKTEPTLKLDCSSSQSEAAGARVEGIQRAVQRCYSSRSEASGETERVCAVCDVMLVLEVSSIQPVKAARAWLLACLLAWLSRARPAKEKASEICRARRASAVSEVEGRAAEAEGGVCRWSAAIGVPAVSVSGVLSSVAPLCPRPRSHVLTL